MSWENTNTLQILPRNDAAYMQEETYHDRRQEEEGDFAYGPGESPDYVEEYVPEALKLLDIAMETPIGSPDAIRLARLIRQKMWKEL